MSNRPPEIRTFVKASSQRRGGSRIVGHKDPSVSFFFAWLNLAVALTFPQENGIGQRTD
jgi:hypothetical protein